MGGGVVGLIMLQQCDGASDMRGGETCAGDGAGGGTKAMIIFTLKSATKVVGHRVAVGVGGLGGQNIFTRCDDVGLNRRGIVTET